MNSISANTTNHRRVVMLIATLVLGVLMTLIAYKTPLTFREFIFPPLIGLAVFEFLFRTRARLRPVTLPLYIVIVLFASEILYGILYNASYGSSWSPVSSFQYLFSEFPYNLYILIDASLVTGLAYYLIKMYRIESWVIAEAQVVEAGNEPVFDERPSSFPAWVQKYNHQIIGFFGWYLANGLAWYFIGNPNTSYNIIANLYIFPINLLALIVLSAIKRTRKLGFGILMALVLNFVLSILLGVFYNGVCFIPFFWR